MSRTATVWFTKFNVIYFIASIFRIVNSCGDRTPVLPRVCDVSLGEWLLRLWPCDIEQAVPDISKERSPRWRMSSLLGLPDHRKWRHYVPLKCSAMPSQTFCVKSHTQTVGFKIQNLSNVLTVTLCLVFKNK